MENTSKTVMRAIDVLETFLKTDDSLSLADVNRLTGINMATSYRLVSTLAKRGYLAQGEKGRYSLGLKMLDFGYSIRRNLKFIDFAYLCMSKLRREMNESVYLAIGDGDESIVIEEVGVDEQVRINSPVGKRLKLHCTAGGKILMAAMTDEARRAYYRRNILQPFTKNTITDIDRLEKELKTARIEGIAFDDEEYRMGIWVAAAPVVNAGGEVIATVGILVLRSHVTTDNTEKYAIAIKSCAGEISQAVSRII